MARLTERPKWREWHVASVEHARDAVEAVYGVRPPEGVPEHGGMHGLQDGYDWGEETTRDGRDAPDPDLDRVREARRQREEGIARRFGALSRSRT